MPSLSSLPLSDFQKALTRENILVLQIIHLAIGASVLGFLIALSFIAAGAGGSGATGDLPERVLLWLSILHGVLAVVLYSVAGWLYRSRFSRERLETLGNSDLVVPRGRTYSDPAMKALMQIRTASILRLALFEGVAMFGLVILLLAVVNRALETHPWLWVNSLSTLVLFALIAVTFPTRDRLETVFRTHIAGNS